MIEAITRNNATVDFGCDKIYQLNCEAGAYITDFSESAQSVDNKFAHAPAANRVRRGSGVDM